MKHWVLWAATAAILGAVVVAAPFSPSAAEAPVPFQKPPTGEYAVLREQLTARFGGRTPKEWGETVTGVRTRLAGEDRAIALTFDACGSPRGKGFDAPLIDFLEREGIPATLFVSGLWIEANPELFRRLAANPLFEIANHGHRHRPKNHDGREGQGQGHNHNHKPQAGTLDFNLRAAYIHILADALTSLFAIFALALGNKGARLANVVIFLGTWAAIKLPMLIIESNFLGLRFALLRLAFTVPCVLAVGYLIERILPAGTAPATAGQGQEMEATP